MAATPLQPNSSGAPAPRPRLLKSGPAPVSKVRLKGANGQTITPKPAGPTLKTSAPAPKPSPEEEAALKAAEEEAARLAQEEYERQMEEYNRQMEEYNRQMEEHNRALAEQAAEEARLAAEAEEARKAEEARLAAEAEAARKAEEERLAAEAEKARQIEEARRAEEAAMAQVALAQAKAAEAAAQAALLEARAKAAALGVPSPSVSAPTPAPAPAPAPASSRPKLAAKPASLKPSGIALKPTTAAAGSSRPAAGGQPAALKPSSVAKPAPGGIALKPAAAAGSSRPSAAVQPAALKPSSVAKPAPGGIALKPAAAVGSSRPAAAAQPAALKPSTVSKPATAAGSSRPVPGAQPAALKPSSVAKPAPSGIAVAKPAVAKPAPSGIAAAKPAVAKPAPSGIAVAKPAVAKPAPSGIAAAKPAVAKPAPLPKAAKPAPVPVPAPEAAQADPEDPNVMLAEGEEPEAEMSEEELAARDAYLAQLQAQAEKPKIWQTPQFKVISIGFGIILAALGVWAYINSERNAAMQEHGKYINKYLKIAQNLNQKGIESLADVQDKGVAFDCPKAAAEDLLRLVVDPDMKGPGGVSYGPPGKTEGVAQNACLVLAIAAEKDSEIDKLIFKTLGEKCNVMRPTLFRWLLQRMTISNNKGIKGKLKKLAKEVAAKPKWRKKGETLSIVWECIGLRAQPSDLSEITKLLEDEAIDNKLALALSNCIGNILDMTDDIEEKKRIGDEVFDKLPAKYRADVIDSLAKSCSPKALAFYKSEMNDSGIWEKKGKSRLSKAMQFFSFYGEDSILEYLLELKTQVGDDERKLHMVETAIQGIVAQNRERTDEEVQKMLGLVFDKLNEDTSAWDEINNKTDPAGVDFVGESSPEYASLMERKKAIEACRKQKQQLIRSLSGLRDYKWVTNILEKYASDADTDISILASQGLEKVKKNTADYAALKAKYNARDKE